MRLMRIRFLTKINLFIRAFDRLHLLETQCINTKFVFFVFVIPDDDTCNLSKGRVNKLIFVKNLIIFF